jgi:hypothetical protein
MSKNLPWLRLYTEIIDDEKLLLLAFEDRWHYIALLACKGRGILDKDEDPQLMMRKVAKKLGVTTDVLDEVARRLAEVGLIERQTLQPLAWGERQFRSDADPTAAERKRRQREKAKNGSDTDESRVTGTDVTRTDTDTDTDSDTEAAKALAPDGAQNNPPDPPAEDTKPEKPSKGKSAAEPPPMTIDDLVAAGVDRQHASDWLKVRRLRKAPLTQSAWTLLKNEAEKAGITTGEAVRISASESWQGFKASWYERMQNEERARSGGRDANGKTVAATSQQRSFKGIQYTQGRVDPLFEDLEEAAKL